MDPFKIYPLPVLILDYALGAIMWTLIGRMILDLFIAPSSEMVIAKVFRQITDPIIQIFKITVPRFLHAIFIPLFVAWWFYMIRFYLIPLIFFGEFGMLSFPLESIIGEFINKTFLSP